MTLQTLNADLTGQILASDAHKITYDSMLNAKIPGGASTHPTWSAGTGAPTFAAAIGSIYSRIDGSSTSTRLYVNTTGSTTWTSVTTAA